MTVGEMKGLKKPGKNLDPTACICRHSKSTAWVRSMYRVREIWECVKNWQSCTEIIL